MHAKNFKGYSKIVLFDTYQFSHLSVRQNHLSMHQGLLRYKFLNLTPRNSDSVNSGWGPEVPFLATSQVMLMLLVQGPHGNHC